MRKDKNLLAAVTAFFCVLSPDIARADVSCSFTVSSVLIDSFGNLSPSLTGNGYTYSWYLCNLSGTYSANNGYSANIPVTSAQCSALYAQLLTARSSGRPIVFGFHGPADCTPTALPANGSWPQPYPTWYAF